MGREKRNIYWNKIQNRFYSIVKNKNRWKAKRILSKWEMVEIYFLPTFTTRSLWPCHQNPPHLAKELLVGIMTVIIRSVQVCNDAKLVLKNGLNRRFRWKDIRRVVVDWLRDRNHVGNHLYRDERWRFFNHVLWGNLGYRPQKDRFAVELWERININYFVHTQR